MRVHTVSNTLHALGGTRQVAVEVWSSQPTLASGTPGPTSTLGVVGPQRCSKPRDALPFDLSLRVCVSILRFLREVVCSFLVLA